MCHKNLLIIFSIVVITGFTSCNTDSVCLDVIPKESKVVSIVDLYSVVKKCNVEKIDELNIFKKAKKEIRNESKSAYKLLEKFKEDPGMSGIDLSSDIYMYYIDMAEDERFISISAEIYNRQKFSEFLNTIADDFNLDIDIDKGDKFDYSSVGNDAAIGWDNEKLVLIVAGNSASYENLEYEIETLMSLKQEERISVNEQFSSFLGNKKDLSVWFSSELLSDDTDFRKIEDEMGIDFAGNSVGAHLNFEDGAVSLSFQAFLNDELQKLVSEKKFESNSFNNNLLNYFPDKSFAALSFTSSPKEIYNSLEEKDVLEKIDNEFEREFDMSIKEVFDGFKGSFIFSLFGFEDVETVDMTYGYGFNQYNAELLPDKYEIGQAGNLSQRDIDQLNEGKTIPAPAQNNEYCINILNVLDEGGDAETAIRNNSLVNWYRGGWEYGPYVEEKSKSYLPVMGFAFDLNNNNFIKKILEKSNLSGIKKKGNIYEFLDNKLGNIYFTFDQNIFLITNSKKNIADFKGGGIKGNNLKNAEISSEFSDNVFYSYINLNLAEFPKEMKKGFNISKEGEKLWNIWNNFAKSIELKSDELTMEIRFNLKNNDKNSLHQIIYVMDDNFKYFTSLSSGQINIQENRFSEEEAAIEEEPYYDSNYYADTTAVYDY